jgi:predicted ABC-type exoprotein transport system permease subunit
MSTTKPTAKPKTKSSFVQWFSSRWWEHFFFVYCLWVFLFLLAPVFIRIGWISVGTAFFFICSIFLLPIHGTIFLSLWSKDNVLFE